MVSSSWSDPGLKITKQLLDYKILPPLPPQALLLISISIVYFLLFVQQQRPRRVWLLVYSLSTPVVSVPLSFAFILKEKEKH